MLWVYTKYEFLDLIRSNRFLLYSSVMTLSIILFNVIYYVVTEKNLEVRDNPAIGENNLDSVYKRMIVMAAGDDRTVIDYVLSIDPVIVISANVFLALLPVFMVFLMFSSISREVETQSVKMLQFFAPRITIYSAKFLSALMITFPFIVLAMTASLLINENRLLPVVEVKQWSYVFKVIYFFASFTLMTLSLALMTSAFSRTVYSAFGYSILFLIFLAMMKYTNFPYLSPFYYTGLIFSPGNDVVVFLPLTFLLFGAVFFATGYLIFHTRKFT